MSSRRKEIHKGIEVHPFASAKLWLNWLSRNHQQEEAVWLKYAKKGSGVATITYEESREAAIMYGWIDGLINSYEEGWYLRRFSKRRTKSMWSQINRDIAIELIDSGRMKRSGLAEVEAAKKDGRWQSAYSSQAKIEVPADLKRLLNQNARAKTFFESISKTNRFAFLVRLEMARTPATREKRLRETMEMLGRQETPYSTLRKKR